jgi:hypothetical protein
MEDPSSYTNVVSSQRTIHTRSGCYPVLALKEQSIPGLVAIQFHENDATAASIAKDVSGRVFVSKYIVFVEKTEYVHEVALVHLSYLLQQLKYILER